LFRIVNSSTSADTVQVLSADGKTPYAMLSTIPDERPDPSGDPEVRFMETRKGQPSAIRAWWYSGETGGYEFIYPKRQARLLARNITEPVLTTRAETTTLEPTKPADLRRVSSKGAETVVALATKPKAVPLTGERQTGTAAPANLAIAAPPSSLAATPRTKLPKTASRLPLVGFVGLLALAGAAGLRLRRTVRA
jgi:hypothetical protein